MRAVTLKQEVTRNEAILIMNWLENKEVSMFLNEETNISTEIRHAINRMNSMIMTQIFNRGGSFYLINTGDENPIGFLKLIKKVQEAEIVVVIGKPEQWGHGLGKASIMQAINICFFQWRVPRIVAKIKSNNNRSIKAFEHIGFKLEKEVADLMIYSVSMDDFISRKLHCGK